jgi:hypothetical protein
MVASLNFFFLLMLKPDEKAVMKRMLYFRGFPEEETVRSTSTLGGKNLVRNLHSQEKLSPPGFELSQYGTVGPFLRREYYRTP